MEINARLVELIDLLQQRDSFGKIQTEVTEILKDLDESRRLTTDTDVLAPTIAFASSFSIIFREGLESALIIDAIITYLEASRNNSFKKYIYYVIILTIGATIVIWVITDHLIQNSGVNKELIKGIAGIFTVAVLFWVSFWVLNKVESRKWIEFVKSKVWKAATTGSILIFVMISFFTVFREGLETIIFYQSLITFSSHMDAYIISGLIGGLIIIIAIALIIRKIVKQLPLRWIFGLTMGIGCIYVCCVYWQRSKIVSRSWLY